MTLEESNECVTNARLGALHAVSGVYKQMLAGSKWLESKTDNTIGRLTTLSYTTKSISALLGMMKDVKTQHITEILTDGSKSFKQKVMDTVGHVRQNFSHETTVAFGMGFVKHGIEAGVVLGVGALAALMAPAAMAVTVGGIAGGAAVWATKYYLSTHAGHHIEGKIASGIKNVQEAAVSVAKGQNKSFLQGVRMAAKGKDPDMNSVVKLAEEIGVHGHGHGHDHGHGHHKFAHTVKGDIKNLVNVKHAHQGASKFVQTVVADGKAAVAQFNALKDYCVSFYNKVTGPKEAAPKQEIKVEGAKAETPAEEKPQATSKKPKATAPSM